MACGPQSFKCRLEMPSGPVDLVFLVGLYLVLIYEAFVLCFCQSVCGRVYTCLRSVH